jgi:hypothetical protein
MRCLSLVSGLLLVAVGSLTPTVESRADVLLVDRVKAPIVVEVPPRGMAMTEVEARWGAPSSKLEPRGGQKPQWPVIRRWVYPQFTVYFERDRVIDAVANKASPEEIGPKPVR